MVSERQRYLAYMLRLWQVGEEEKVWRASLENAHSGARQGFASLNALLAFLEDETGEGCTPARGEPCPGSGEDTYQESDSYRGG
jgi:hypothetical protein